MQHSLDETDEIELKDRQAFILTIDDDPDLAAIIALQVQRWGHESRSVGSAAELWRFLDHETPDVMLMDVMLGDADGSRLVAEVKARLPDLPVIMITRSTSVEAAVRCMKHGAADYITKPIDFARLKQAIGTAIEVGSLARRARDRPAARQQPYRGLIGRSPAMQRLFHLIENVAPVDVSALILGETGTGKELIARAIHRASPRGQGPFVPVNAAAIPHELIESELFGHERGAFTGAEQVHVGFCEQAEGGTLFLDEIGEMGFNVQVKLLRFLQDHVVQRVGSRKSRQVDVRVLAATNVDPREQIAKRKLREDLYYRLRVVSLAVPALRERGSDVALLASHFLTRAASRHGREMARLSVEAIETLVAYPWPGNVRELENVIEEAVVMNHGAELVATMLPAEVRLAAAEHLARRAAPPVTEASEPDPPKPLSAREESEKQAIEEALEKVEGEIEEAAEELGISRATIYRKIKKYGLPSRRSS